MRWFATFNIIATIASTLPSNTMLDLCTHTYIYIYLSFYPFIYITTHIYSHIASISQQLHSYTYIYISQSTHTYQSMYKLLMRLFRSRERKKCSFLYFIPPRFRAMLALCWDRSRYKSAWELHLVNSYIEACIWDANLSPIGAKLTLLDTILHGFWKLSWHQNST